MRPHDDSISESRPPFPLFVDEVQPPPAQYGRDSYTTRPPWMAQQQTLLNGQNLTATYAVDGASLSPFPVAPTPIGDADSTSVIHAASSPAIDAGEVAKGVAVAAGLSMATPRRRSGGSGVFTMLFLLFAKSIPLMLVLGGGYYTYSYFFGTPPIVETVRRKLSGEPASAAENNKPKSRAGQMMQQTRDVVSANDARINFANALAEGDVDLDALGEPQAVDPNALAAQVSAAVASATAAQAVDAEGTPSAPRRVRNAPPSYDVSQVIPGRLDLPSPVPPSVAFIIWVDRARISGLRAGESSKIIVNDLTVEPEQILDHSQGIVVESVDPATSTVRFRDRQGAIIGKRF